MAIDIRKIIESIQNYEPVGLTAYRASASSIEGIGKILELYLRKIHLQDYYFQFFYAVRELVENGKKANLKRLYFKNCGLNLENHDEYTSGMQDFKDEVYTNIGQYEEQLKQEGLYVRTSFEVDQEHFYITIVNNVLISPEEEERIRERISRSGTFDSVEEAFQTVLDSTEGAGLGLVMLVLMLRKIGLDNHAFAIRGINDTTVATIKLPRHDLFIRQLKDLTERIENELEIIPQFPETMRSLQQMIKDPEIDFARIERSISTDPGMAAELLKMVNSASFGVNRKVLTIQEAVKLVGLKGIRNLLTAYGTVSLVSERYGDMKNLWEHSHRVAVFASVLARRYNLKSIYETVYSASLLHDLGRVLVEFLSPDLFDKLRRFSVEKKMPAEEFERFALGTHHAEVGAQMAERWDFPRGIINTIRYHHNPEASAKADKELIYTVYCANFLDDLDRERTLLDHMSAEVISTFKLHSEEKINQLLVELKLEYSRVLELL